MAGTGLPSAWHQALQAQPERRQFRGPASGYCNTCSAATTGAHLPALSCGEGAPPAAQRGGCGGKAKRYMFFTNGTGAATNLRFESDRPSHGPSRGQVSTVSSELLKKITSDKWVLQAVNGCLIEWVGTPHQISEPFTPRFSKAECQSLTAEVDKMLQKQAIGKEGSQRPMFNL